MSTLKAARPITKKSTSTRDSNNTGDFSGASNPATSAAGFSASHIQSKPSSASRLGAFYSSAPVLGISPAIQAKFIQQNAGSEAQTTDEIEEAPVQAEFEPVQFACAACAAEDSGDLVQSQADEEKNPTTEPVQMWSCEDHEKPTCTLQTKADANSPLQFACAECEAEQSEEQGKESAVQAQSAAEPADDDDPDVNPVQEKCAACESEEVPVQEKASRDKSTKRPKGKGSVLQEANTGLQNAHSPLPHGDTIQAAFGHHDISTIRSEVGGSAGRASQRMGALAYASGDRIGFRHSPNLHLAAHEAAHTVQQRAGLKLPGNVGKPGDQWETHADRVADAVVAGESAEPLLDAVAPAPAAANVALPAQPASAATDGISGAVQHSFTSTAVHQVEPEREAEAASAGGGGAGAEGASAEGGGPGAEEGAEEGGEADAEANPESAEEADPAADCAAAEGGAGEEPAPPAPEAAAAAPAEAPPPATTPEKGRCYNAEASDPPEGSEEPSSDAPPAEVQAEAQVTYGAWEEPNDACECAAAEAIPPNPAEAAVSDGGAAEASTESAPGAETESPAAASSSGGGGAGGGGSGNEGESSEGNFGAGEASRDAAVAEFDAATNEVNRVPNRARKLARGLHFGAAPPGSAVQEANRAAALTQIRAFMQSATAQIDGAVAFVRDQVPGRLGGMAEMIKANIESAMAAEKGAISARIGQSRSAAIGEAAAASGAINAEFDASVGLVNGETDAAIQALTDAYITSTDAISGREQTSLSEVNTRFSTGRDDHDTKGTTFANTAVATGQSWVDAYDSCRSGPGNEYVKNGDDGFWDGCLTVRRAKAQQESACKTAGAMGKNMVDMAKQKGFALREQRTQYRCAIIAGAGEAQGTLDSTMDGLITGLENGRTSTLSGLAQVRDSNLSAVENSLIARFQSLDQQEHEQRQAVNDSGYVQQLAVEQMAHQVAAGLVKSVTSAMETLEQTLSNLREQLLAGDAPSPEQLSAQLMAAEEGLGEGVGTLLDKMEEGASAAEASMMEAGQTSASALADITTGNASMTAESEQGYSAELSALVAAASDTMAQLSDTHVTNAQESAATGVEGMVQVAAGFTEATEGIYGVVDTAIATSLSELDTELANMAGQLEGKIAGEAWLAASNEQPAWKGVLAVVLIILVIIASIVVTVLTAGAAAAALGPILGAAVLGAVVGAVSAGLIQVINNWAAGDDLTKGLVQAVVMGAVGGAIGGAIGAGANGLAQVGVNAAIRAGSSTLTRAAINVGINLAGDMVAEGATQAFGYYAYGQQFNWQGFVMAGGMSVVSTGRGRGGFAGELDTNASLRGLVTRTPRAPGAAPPRLRAPGVTDAAIGLGLAGGIEAISFLATGTFDANRFATSMASSIGSLAASGGSHAGRTDTPDATPVRPHTEASAPAPVRPTGPDTPTAPRPVAPDVEAPPTPRPVVPEVETPTTPRSAAPETEGPNTVRPVGPDVESVSTPRRSTDVDVDDTSPNRIGIEETDGTGSRRTVDEQGNPEASPQGAMPEGGRLRTSGESDLGSFGGRRVTAELELPGNRRLQVLEDGTCVVCASPCTQISRNYAAELAADPVLAARLQRIERRLAREPRHPHALEAAIEVRSLLEAARAEVPDRLRAEFGSELRSRPDLARQLSDLQIRIRESPANQRLQRRMRALEAQLLEIRARDVRMRRQMGGDDPYDPVRIREELKLRYGDDKVTSTTVPPTSKPNVRMRGGHIDATLPDGSTVRIVFDRRGFPIFDDVARLEIHLENGPFRGASYDGQLRMATRDLRARIQRGEIPASGFSDAQMTAIRSGAEKIPGYTWHHHQDTGRMQLVPEAIHSAVRHTGWESISDGV